MNMESASTSNTPASAIEFNQPNETNFDSNEDGGLQSEGLNKKRKRKRRNININISSDAKEAQLLERQRLERLDRLQESSSASIYAPFIKKSIPNEIEDDEIQLLDEEDADLFEENGTSNGKTIREQEDLIVLSSDEEPAIRPSTSSGTSGRNDAGCFLQHRVELLRTRQRRKSAEYDRMETGTDGKLLVNAVRPADDPEVYVAPHLTNVLQPHQLGGVKFMYDNVIESLAQFHKSAGFGCILAHSMGLGKTIQAITFVEIFIRVTGQKRVLIICPVNVIQNWNAEFERWLPKQDKNGATIRNFEIFVLGDCVKTFEARAQLIADWNRDGGVLLMGYEMFRLLLQQGNESNPQGKRLTKKRQQKQRTVLDLESNLANMTEERRKDIVQKEELRRGIREALLSPGPDLVICDEGHRIKNLNTEVANALSAIHTRRRIVLTGYPLQNNLMEYFCMVEFVRPNILGSKMDFSIMFDKPIRNGQCIDSTKADIKFAKQRIHVLTQLLKGFVQRRTQHLLKKILPVSREYVLLLRKSPIQHALCRAFYQYANGQFKAGEASFNPLKAFAICMKIVNHPDLLYNAVKKRQQKFAIAPPSDTDPATKPNNHHLGTTNGGVSVNDGHLNPFDAVHDHWENSPQSQSYLDRPVPFGQQQTFMSQFNGGSNSAFGYQKPPPPPPHWTATQSWPDWMDTAGMPSSTSHQQHQLFGSTPFFGQNDYARDNNRYQQQQRVFFPPPPPNQHFSHGYQQNQMPGNSSHTQMAPINGNAHCFSGANVWALKEEGVSGENGSDLPTDFGGENNKEVKNGGEKKRKGGTKERELKEDLLSDEFLIEDSSISLEWAEPLLQNYQTGVAEHSVKFGVAISLISETVQRGEKILLFSQSVVTLDLLEDILKKLTNVKDPDGESITFRKNSTYCRFDGTVSGSDRQKLIKRFNEDPGLWLFLISTRAGSLGVNLTSASRVIIFDVSWNPCHDAQAICRIYRYGQKRRTFIYRLIMENCMEKQVFNRQITKHGLQKRVIDEQSIEANVTQSEVENLMKYDESRDVLSQQQEFGLEMEEEDSDEMLANLVRDHSKWFTEIPFLHESMMLEEQGLSAQEKTEAELLYQREKGGFNFPPNDNLPPNGLSRGPPPQFFGGQMDSGRLILRHPFHNSLLQTSDRLPNSTPIPRNIEFAEMMRRQLPQQYHPQPEYPPTTIDRELRLRIISAPAGYGGETHYTLRPGQKVTMFSSPIGFYFRTFDGIILDASSVRNIFDGKQRGFNLTNPVRNNDIIQIDD